MSTVRVSAGRFRSMLRNRHLTLADIDSALDTVVDLHELSETDQELGFEDIRRIARYFKRPWAYLLCDQEEKFPDLGQDNRTFENQRVPVSPDLLAAVQATENMLDAADELFPEDTVDALPIRLTTDTAPERAGSTIRAFLGVDPDAQLKAKDPYAALRLWVDAVQARGVYVSQRRLRDQTVRAFSVVRNRRALVVLDTGDTAYARIFSVLHEYCHVLLRSTGICDLDDHSATERYCNAVAAAALLPNDLIASAIAKRPFGASPDVDDEELRLLSKRLRVSQAALLIRLRDMGMISPATYDSLESRRRARRRPKAKPGGTYYPTEINRVGRRFARQVVSAMSEGVIDRQDASALLGVGEHSMDSYRAELEKSGGLR